MPSRGMVSHKDSRAEKDARKAKPTQMQIDKVSYHLDNHYPHDMMHKETTLQGVKTYVCMQCSVEDSTCRWVLNFFDDDTLGENLNGTNQDTAPQPIQRQFLSALESL